MQLVAIHRRAVIVVGVVPIIMLLRLRHLYTAHIWLGSEDCVSKLAYPGGPSSVRSIQCLSIHALLGAARLKCPCSVMNWYTHVK